ncbi:MAG: Crp/Fnr family transcriptional regulator [Candidatus Dormibacteria bacterium]
MANHKVDMIKKVPLFAHCTGRELEFVSAQMDEVEVKTGSELTHEGKRGHSFFVLLKGSARVVINGQGVGDLSAGDFFGEISMIDMGPATATVTTTSDATLLVLSHQQFRDAIAGNDKLSMQVMQAMAQRLRSNQAAGLGGDRH